MVKEVMGVPIAEGSALFVINLVAMLVYACTGVGETVIFQLGWYLMFLVGLSSGGLLSSNIVLSVVTIPLFVTQGLINFNETNWPLAFWMGAGTIAGTSIGLEVLVSGSHNVWTKRCLGFLLLLVFTMQCWLVSQEKVVYPAVLEHKLEAKDEPPESPEAALANDKPEDAGRTSAERRMQRIFDLRKWEGILTCLVVGLINGFLSGLFTFSGFVPMYVYFAGVTREEWVATGSWINIASLTFRICWFAIEGRLDTELLEIGLVSMIGGFLGLALGNYVSDHIDETRFKYSILLVLLYGGIVLSTAETGHITLYLLGIVTGIIILIVLLLRVKQAVPPTVVGETTKLVHHNQYAEANGVEINGSVAGTKGSRQAGIGPRDISYVDG